MEKKRSPFTTVNTQKSKEKCNTPNISSGSTKSTGSPQSNLPKNSSPNKSPKASTLSAKPKSLMSKKGKGDCTTPSSSSGTQYFKKEEHGDFYVRITTDEYVGLSESLSGSSDTFHCIHGPEGKVYTEKGLLKRNLKNLDKIPNDRDWNDKCAPAYGWDMSKTLAFLVTDPVAASHTDRLEAHLRDFAKISINGYRVDVLTDVIVIVDYLVESLATTPQFSEELVMLLMNMKQPIPLKAVSDVVTYFEDIGYLLMRLEDDRMFSIVSDALLGQLSVPNSARGPGTARRRVILAAAARHLYQTTVRMLAIATSYRFPTFLHIAMLLAYDSVDNCIEMMKENIIENIFYRFNPYFPEKVLPVYDINPADPQDYNVKLGDSGVNMELTLSLLLVLLKTTKEYLSQNPEYRKMLPFPDSYSQRCFIWAYRYECRAREHQHERTTLTVVVATLLHCFGDRLENFSYILMPDVMSLSVLTELPPRSDWLRTVNFNTTQLDVHFKKILIYLSVQFTKVFPSNIYIIESRHWLLGLMYLVDPGLCSLRARWSPALFAELRKTAMQALVSVLPLAPPRLALEYGLIRRIMWYVEWYSESPYELPVLYWCLRLLQVVVENRGPSTHQHDRTALHDLFDTHGVIIIMHLAETLLEQKLPPVEKSQAVLSVCLALLTRAVDLKQRLTCCVYPAIKWPSSINGLVKNMIDVILFSLDKHFLISDRWLVSLMHFLWEAVIWDSGYRALFIADNGIYKILDIITLTRGPVQCIALALLCDVARAGDAVGELVTWRANFGATHANPNIVKQGATIVSLLASIFNDECQKTGVSLDQRGIIQDLDNPLMAAEVRKAIYDEDFRYGKHLRTPVCFAAADLAGSRLSKVFALFHMLSDDLSFKVSLADEAYNLYKNITLSPEDEAILVLCSHYLTIKLNEVWTEVRIQCPDLVQPDEVILGEFLHIGKGWAKDIELKQHDVFTRDCQKKCEEESSLYAFIARVRLNISLDALREVRCVVRSADRHRMTHLLLHDAVLAHHRRSIAAKETGAPVLRTYRPPLDDQNITGQYVKVHSIHPKNKPKPLEVNSASN